MDNSAFMAAATSFSTAQFLHRKGAATHKMSAAQDLLTRCNTLQTKLQDIMGNDAPLQQLSNSLDQLVSRIYDAPDDIPAIMDAVCHVQEQLGVAVRSTASVHTLIYQVFEVVQELAKNNLQQQQQLEQYRQQLEGYRQLEEYKFLLRWRDYIRLFRLRVTQVVSRDFELSVWDELSAYLQEEENRPQEAQPVTTAVKAVLVGMGLEWEDFCLLREVADADIAIMHTGSLTQISSALRSVDTMPMPSHLQHTRGALKKVVQYLNADIAPGPRRRMGR